MNVKTPSRNTSSRIASRFVFERLLGVATRSRKTMSLLRSLTVVGLICLQTGCSSALLSIGPDVALYTSLSENFTRATVIRDLGAPTKTTPFREPRPVDSLLAEQHPAFQGDFGFFKRSASVSIIDEYVIQGHIGDFTNVYATRGLAVMTLGLSELVFLPAAISEVVSSAAEVHHLSFGYSPADILVAYRFILDTK